MRNILYALLILSSSHLLAQEFTTTIIEDIDDRPLVYSEHTDKVYILINENHINNGGSLGIINPETKLFESFMFIGPNPTVLSLDSTGQVLYVGLDGNGYIKKINLNTLTIESSFSVGLTEQNEMLFPESITVDPNDQNTISVTRYRKNVSPGNYDIAIFENGIMWNGTEDMEIVNSIAYVGDESEYVWGLNNETTSFGLSRYDMGGNSIHHDNQFQGYISGFGTTIQAEGNRIYSSNGAVIGIDEQGDPMLLNQFDDITFFNNNETQMTIDPYENLLVYMFEGNGLIIRRYDADTFAFVDQISIPELSDDTVSIDCYAPNSYVFSTQDQEVVFVEYENVLGLTENHFNDSKFKVFPNPVNDHFKITNGQLIHSVHLFDSKGQLLKKYNGSSKYSVSDLASGLYFINIETRNTIEKIKILKK